MCSGLECYHANQLAGSACRHIEKSRAFTVPACILAKLRKIVKYFNIYVIYCNVSLMKYVTDTEIGNIDCITLTKLCDKVNVGKALDICSRNFLRDRLVPKLHCLDRKP